MRNRSRQVASDEQGTVLVLFALLMTGLLGMAALLVDFGLQRVSAQQAQSMADMASLGAGKDLSNGSPVGACQDAVTYVNANAQDLSPKINAAAFCAQAGNSVGGTTCTVLGGITQAKPTATVGRYTVKLVYPVLASDLADSHFSGSGANDGANPCQRMGVTVSVTNSTTFGQIFGVSSMRSSRLAVVKADNGGEKLVPALWLLDPFGCPGLSVSGAGTVVTVGTGTVPGLITIDSNGSACSGSQTTLDVPSGSLRAIPPTGTTTGVISLVAPGTSTCAGSSCDPADISGTTPRVSPKPTQVSARVTRAPVDWQFNCKYSYPAYHSISIDGCPHATPAYIDNLVSAVGNTTGVAPTSFQTWTASGRTCNPSGTITVSGNWLVNCPTFAIGNGTDITFSGGNVIIDGHIRMTGGSLSVNTANASVLPTGCLPPSVSVLNTCIAHSSADAAFVYMRNGEMNVTGGALTLRNTFVYQRAGAIKDTGGAAPIWTPPAAGPFTGLSLWSDFSDAYTINGGGGLQLAGTFFTPEADPFKVTGGGGLSQQAAQFISYRLDLSGGGSLNMAPNPTTAVPVPAKGGMLIR